MKFDFVIGNPPYQVANSAGTAEGNRTMPVYHLFMEAAYEVGDKTLLITPARFLFDAGKTPKDFNQRMLKSPHFSVMSYYVDSAAVFSSVEIKGGVAITYNDKTKERKPIGIMLPFIELFPIVDKVQNSDGFTSLSSLFYPKYAYHFLQRIYDDKPNLIGCMSDVHKFDLESNVFDLMPDAFVTQATNANESFACIYGRTANQRAKRFIEEKYISYPENYNYFKVFVAISNGSGNFGETLSSPFVGQPKEGNTVTFLSIGKFEDSISAHNLLKYLKTKFLRSLLNALKITQHNPAPVWNLIPVQNFTPESDIDWSKSIAQIDQQLYRKYGLTEEEISFIETHVKEMT